VAVGVEPRPDTSGRPRGMTGPGAGPTRRPWSAGYKQLSDPGGTGSRVTLAFCWSHWRQKFVEIDRAGPAPIAHEALALYAIESRIRGRSAEERRAVRQAETKPLVEKLKGPQSSTASTRRPTSPISSPSSS